MLHLFFRIITLCYSESWPLSRKDATRWNVAVRLPDTADCSLRRSQGDATRPSSGRAARCEGELSGWLLATRVAPPCLSAPGSFRHVLHQPVYQHLAPCDTCRTTLCFSTLSYRTPITLPSHNSKFLLPASANCASYPILAAALPSIHASAPPPHCPS